MGVFLRRYLRYHPAGAIQHLITLYPTTHRSRRHRYHALVWLQDQAAQEENQQRGQQRVLLPQWRILASGYSRRCHADPLVEKPAVLDRQAHQEITAHQNNKHAQQYRGQTGSTAVGDLMVNTRSVRGDQHPRQKLYLEEEIADVKYGAEFEGKWYCGLYGLVWGVWGTGGVAVCACNSYTF